MTELFKCRKAGTKCCASKSLIKKALGQKDTPPESTSPAMTVGYTTPTPVSMEPVSSTYDLTVPMHDTRRPTTPENFLACVSQWLSVRVSVRSSPIDVCNI